MGGEHEIGFHNRGHCSWLHGKSKITMSPEDQIKWVQLKPRILLFMESYLNTDTPELNHYLTESINDVKKINSAEEIYLFWHESKCSGNYGALMHDIAYLLCREFPGKICGYFERCSSHQQPICDYYDPAEVLYSDYYKGYNFYLWQD